MTTFAASLCRNRLYFLTFANIKCKEQNRMSKYPLLGMTLAELQSVAKRLGMPGFAAKQIASWLYDKKVVSIDEMTNLSLKHRNLLKQNYEVGDRKSTRLNSSHANISYAVFCLK